MKKRILRIMTGILILSILFSGITGCTDDASGGDLVVTDMLGREVTISGDVETAVCIGPGTLRLYTYVADVDKLCGVEQIELDNPIGRPYTMVYTQLSDLTVIGPGGPANSPDAEKLLTAEPDVIFSTYAKEAAAADDLQEKTGIPVISVSYGATAPFDDTLNASLKLIGTVMGTEERAEEVLAFINDCKADLNTRTSDIADADKVSVYYGAQSYKGTHGIESTTGGYALFTAINTQSVVDQEGISGYVMLDKEQLLEWDPEVIFVDLGGIALVSEDRAENPSYYEALTAFESGKVYSQLPYNYYSANIEVAIIDAYYMGMVLYPEQFTDVTIDQKAKEVFEMMLGADVYEQLVTDFGPLDQLTF